MKQTVPNIHQVLIAINELEKLPVVKAYILLLQSVKGAPVVTSQVRE